MALIKDGYFQDTYWASRYWQEDYWPEYAAPVTGGDSSFYYYRQRKKFKQDYTDLFASIKELLKKIKESN